MRGRSQEAGEAIADLLDGFVRFKGQPPDARVGAEPGHLPPGVLAHLLLPERDGLFHRTLGLQMRL